MEDSIDLRPYFGGIVRHWWFIVGAAILGILTASSIYSNQTAYAATAWVAISEPSQRLQFDPRIESTQEVDLLLESYPELALTDEVVSQLIPVASERTNGGIHDLATLRSMLSVEKASAPRLMRLTVSHEDPQLATDLANLWAEQFAKAVENIYRNPGGQIEFYQAQLVQSEAELSAAEAALVTFQARSRQGLALNQLNALLELQKGYLSDQRDLQLLLEDIQALRLQLSANTSATITYADQLTALTLQLEVYDSINELVPDQFQFQMAPAGDLTTSDRATQLQLLNELEGAAQASLNASGLQLPALENQIFALQSEYQAMVNEFERLTHQREVAQSTHDTLARKLDEIRIGSQDQGSSVQIASRATVPMTPARSNPTVLFGLAILLPAFLAVMAIALVVWWRLNVVATP